MFSEHCNQRSWARQLSIVLGLWGVVASAQADGGRWIADRVVAEVDGRLVTASQLEFEARTLVVAAGGVGAATAPLDERTLTELLEVIVDQRLVTLEADKLEAYPLEEGELERAVSSFRARFPSEARFREFLEAHEAQVDDLKQVLRRALRAQRVLEAKLRLKARVSEGEARRYATEHPELHGAALEVVRQRLATERFEALKREELAQQRRKVDVRLLGPYAPRVGTTP